MTKSNLFISDFSAEKYLNIDLLAQKLQSAHGKVPYNMTNDYMFRAVLQSNNKVLRGLICSLLHLNEAEVQSVEIMNPIILGEAICDKEIRLDVNVSLNNRSIINLEMQVANKLNWQERSVLYLSRSFDRLNRGQDYLEVQPAIHIGFLDYTLFPEHPEFYSTYKLMNVKNHNVYSGNFVLSVVDLSCIDLATDEDKKYHIDIWARLFKATTWEEIKSMAAMNEYIQEASRSIFQFNTDEQIRKLCRDRVEYHQDLRNYERTIAQRDTAIEELQATIAEQKELIADLRKTVAEQKELIAGLSKTVAEQKELIADLRKTIAEQNIAADDLQNTIAEQNVIVTDLRNTIAGQNIAMTDLHNTISKLSTDGAEQHAALSDLRDMMQKLIDEK